MDILLEYHKIEVYCKATRILGNAKIFDYASAKKYAALAEKHLLRVCKDRRLSEKLRDAADLCRGYRACE